MPGAARVACSRACSTSAFGYVALTSSVMMRIRTIPPSHSASVNCHAIKIHNTMPSSMTRLVDENRNASDGMSAAPLANIERVTAAEAYEHDELAAPKTVARAISCGPSRPSSSRMRRFDTSVCTAPERAKPSTRLQPTAQNIPADTTSASPILLKIAILALCRSALAIHFTSVLPCGSNRRFAGAQTGRSYGGESITRPSTRLPGKDPATAR
jgi:hypothetical protein